MTTKARQFADQVSNLITISSGGSDFITPDVLSASVTAASAAAVNYTDQEIFGVQEDINNIDLSSTIVTASSAAVSELDNRIIISSGSPTGDFEGRLWIDTSTSSAPLLQTYSSGSFKEAKTSKTKIRGIGGTTTISGNYAYHTFTGTSQFTLLEEGPIDIFLVGGGGGGYKGVYAGSGGGGGGYTTNVFSLPCKAGFYSLTVGGGGGNNANGGPSSIILQQTYTANGGNTSASTYSGGNGGSGGGSGANNSQNGSVCFGGTNGGNGGSGSYGAGIGQGTTTRAFQDSSLTLYSGGGGGGGSAYGGSFPGGPGGSGGGGNGGGPNGVGGGGGTNTGGGGGGGGGSPTFGTPGQNGGPGGSGIVIIRYLI